MDLMRWLVALGQQCSGGADHGLTALQVLCFLLAARLLGAPAPAEQLATGQLLIFHLRYHRKVRDESPRIHRGGAFHIYNDLQVKYNIWYKDLDYLPITN
jgi:hypothetical protein